jgi:hypothetical protein
VRLGQIKPISEASSEKTNGKENLIENWKRLFVPIKARGFETFYALRLGAKYPSRIHFGCGKVYLPGFLNVDVGSSKADLKVDAYNLRFFPAQSFDLIYSNAVLEHIGRPSLLQVFVTTQPMQFFSGIESTQPRHTVVSPLWFLNKHGDDHNIL